MAAISGNYPILSISAAARQCYDLLIHTPELAQLAQPGQFVHIRRPGFFLRRPISIAAIDRQAGTIRLIFQVRGAATGEMAGLQAGQMLDLLGPLGHGFEVGNERVILVGGGIGVPPLLELARRAGDRCVAIIGFRTADDLLLQADLAQTGARVIVCTEDGSAGHKGMVTGPLAQELAAFSPGLICACGPKPMLRAVASLAEEADIPCQLSLEERMGCGVGACLVCACKTRSGQGEEEYSHVCCDGPVFDSRRIVWE